MRVSVSQIVRFMPLCFIMVACSAGAARTKPPVSPPVSAEAKAAAVANGNFAVDIYKHLAQANPGENVFVSPFSLSMALTMAAEGATDQTLQEMSDCLHLPAGKLAELHQGQRDIRAAVTPSIPKAIAAKLTRLRADLKIANDRTMALQNVDNFEKTRISYVAALKLAKEINELRETISGYEFNIANALWVEQSFPISPQFVNALKPSYGTTVFPVDFKKTPQPSRLRINQWVAEQTSDRIRDLLTHDDVTDLTRLVITNAVFFKGDWAEPFETGQTRSEPIAQPNERPILVPMMHQLNAKTARYAAFQSTGQLFKTPEEIPFEQKDDDPSLYPDASGFTMLSLDYQGHKVQMLILVPQSVDGLGQLEQSLTYEKLQGWCHTAKQRTVVITLPKYKLDARYNLPQTLNKMRMIRAFVDPAQQTDGAQFGKLTTSLRSEDRLYITDVIHKTDIDVNEVGTQAAAATAIVFNVVSEGGPDPQPKTRPFIPIFKADKPFLFLIRESETESILFFGRYVVPNRD